MVTTSSEEKVLIGESEPMRKVNKLIGKVARTDSTVLITGETGTGKELAAREIHRQSARCDGPFVVVDCTRTELFALETVGHEKGSFTGADKARPGLLRMAHEGTVFFDELGAFSPDLQPQILRFLQEREVRSLGATAAQKVDVRVIGATNRNLVDMVKKGKFRDDLYARFNVVPLALPPLRERKEDIPLLFRHFLSSKGANIPVDFSVFKILAQYRWPYNVRELESLAEYVSVLLNGEQVERLLDEHIPLEFFDPESLLLEIFSEEGTHLSSSHDNVFLEGKTLVMIRDIAYRKAIECALSKTRGRVTHAAKLLGINPKTLYYLKKRLEIQEKSLKHQALNGEQLF